MTEPFIMISKKSATPSRHVAPAKAELYFQNKIRNWGGTKGFITAGTQHKQ